MTRRLLCALLVLLAVAAPARAGDRLFAVTDTEHVVSFDSSAPGALLSDRAISGLGGTETIVGLDSRPRGGALYIVTNDSGTGRLYTVDPATGGASLVATLAADPADLTNPYTSLPVTSYGLDVNPVVDRLRLVAATDVNLRVNPSSGLVTSDGDINPGPTTTVVGVAYANNVPGATTTTLLAYDYASDVVGVINPPNNGTFGVLGPSGLAAAAAQRSAFDVAPSGTGYATHLSGGVQRLSTVDLTTGAHTVAGAVPAGLLGLSASTANLARVALPAVSVSEQADAVTVTVVRDNPRGRLSVTWATGGGTATAGSDYTASGAPVTFEEGEVSKTVTIPLLGDAVDEPGETFGVTFTRDANQEGTVLAPTATVTIIDDDVPEPAAPDGDGDGVPSTSDNCPNVANAGQADGNGNGVGTACDLSEVPRSEPPVPPAPGRCANARVGTAGEDALLGTAAGDALNGLAGIDTLIGAGGDDCLRGAAGDDWLAGGDGADELRGGAGSDVLRGGAGDDRLFGDAGDDRLDGGAGRDAIDAGRGGDVVNGGLGNDTIRARNGRRNVIDCGAGTDTVTADVVDTLKRCETTRP